MGCTLFSEEWINTIPLSLLQQIREHASYQPLLQDGDAIEQLLQNKSKLKQAFQHLDPYVKQSLTYILIYFPASFFTIDQLLACDIDDVAGAELKAAVIQLSQLGMLYVFHRHRQQERWFILPQDLVSHWFSVCFSLEDHFSSIAKENTMDNDMISCDGFMEDVITILQFVQYQPITLTKKGVLPKRITHMLQQEIRSLDEHFQFVKFKEEKYASYPPYVAVLLDYSLRLGLTSISDDQLHIQPSVCNEWLQGSEQEHQIWMEKFIHEVFYPSTIYVQHLLSIIPLLSPHSCYAVADIMNQVRKELKWKDDQLEDEILTQFHLRCLKPLQALDCVLLHYDEHDDLYISLSEKKRIAMLYLQSDFSLLKPPHLQLDVQFELQLMTEKQDQQYKITKNSVMKACLAGRDGNYLCSFLQQVSKYGLPKNVEKCMMDWSRDAHNTNHGSIHTHNMHEMTSQRQQYQHVPLLFSNSCQSAEAIDVYNYMLDSQEINSILYSRYKDFQGSIEKKYLTFDDIYAYPHVIPSHWMHAYRKYHIAINVQIIETALHLHTYIMVRHKDENVYFVPKRLTKCDQAWKVEGNIKGRGQLSFHSSDWQEIKLILPGMNDKNK
ncbi:hypothetical protein [Longirhabdus pacifica]|uniref:hypothetical protein n=1 Tax=Longirhabdus pacifica TaxID=2305227 RepID=UPI0010091C4B|nr:hypothetical protein [Longirhabdus pacifica]